MKHSIHSFRARAACGGAFLVALGACTLTPSGSQNSYTSKGSKPELERIEGNRLLANNLEILNPLEKTVDGRKIAQFTLKNRYSGALRFAWAVDWFDEDGFRINDNQRVFQPVSLGGYGVTEITITAPKTGSLSWRLNVNSPDEVH
jgi:uncharacterized protein YcfL